MAGYVFAASLAPPPLMEKAFAPSASGLSLSAMTAPANPEPGATGTPPVKPEPSWRDMLAIPLGLLGAVAGAFLGAWVVWFGYHSGFLVIPVQGLLIGFGTILVARRGGWTQGLIALVVCTLATFITHWRVRFPLSAFSVAAFRDYLHTLTPFLLAVHAIGIAIAVWIAWTAPTRRK